MIITAQFWRSDEYVVDPLNAKASKLRQFEVTLWGPKALPGPKKFVSKALYEGVDDFVATYKIRFDYNIVKGRWIGERAQARVVWINSWPWSAKDTHRMTQIRLYFLRTRGLKLFDLSPAVAEYKTSRSLVAD